MNQYEIDDLLLLLESIDISLGCINNTLFELKENTGKCTNTNICYGYCANCTGTKKEAELYE